MRQAVFSPQGSTVVIRQPVSTAKSHVISPTKCDKLINEGWMGELSCYRPVWCANWWQYWRGRCVIYTPSSQRRQFSDWSQICIVGPSSWGDKQLQSPCSRPSRAKGKNSPLPTLLLRYITPLLWFLPYSSTGKVVVRFIFGIRLNTIGGPGKRPTRPWEYWCNHQCEVELQNNVRRRKPMAVIV